MSTVLSPVDEYGQDRQIAQLRVPPHSIEGESSVLGGLLLDNATLFLLSNFFFSVQIVLQEAHTQIFTPFF